MKFCGKCSQTLPLASFSVDNGRKDGRSNYCKTCRQAISREYLEKNRDKVLRIKAKHRKLHAEKIKQYNAEYRSRNRKRAAENARRWAKSNPEKRAKIKTAYRARKHSETFYILDREIKHLKASPCAVCGSQGPVDIDHIVPLSKGGRHSVGNLQPLCRSCNTSKSDKFFADWLYRVVPARLSA